jgi:hypothetical protein
LIIVECLTFSFSLSGRQRFIIIFLFTALIAISAYAPNPTQAWTFDTIWWLGHSEIATEEQSSGYVHIYYTYPTTVQAGEEFDVGITLQYIKNAAVVTNWLLFTNVSVALRNYNFSDGEVLDISVDNKRDLVRPGEFYSNSFSLKAPESPGKYLVFPRWVSWFGPGTTVLENFDWDMENYYNQTQREQGIIRPERMPEVNVVEQKDNENIRNLAIEFNEPYDQINPPIVTISNKTSKTDFTLTEDGLSFSFLFGSSYDVTIPKVIEMQPGEMRAIFYGWSDGGEYTKIKGTNEMNDNITRSILMNGSKELFALYKTQYKMDVTSQDNIGNPNGTGWYDSGAEAHYSVNSLGGFFNFPFPKSFDRWIGDISSDNAASGVLDMDGPKKLQALWKMDYTFLAIWLGIGGSTLGIYEFVRKVRVSNKSQQS